MEILSVKKIGSNLFKNTNNKFWSFTIFKIGINLRNLLVDNRILCQKLIILFSEFIQI